MIVDTSVVFDALVEGPFSDTAVKLLSGSHCFAPDHLEVELPGALTRAVRRRDISATFAQQAYASLPRVMPHLEPSQPLLARSFSLSLALTHPLYDCLFLSLAEAREDVLATADRRFAHKLSGTPYARHLVHLADWRA